VAEKLLRFVTVSRHAPDKRPAAARRRDFDEISAGFDAAGAALQAARCSQCGVPYCQVHCPLHNNIPDWLKLTAEGRLEEGYAMAAATNTFPEICGRICPQDRLCEGNCVIEKGFGGVTIGAVENFLVETAFAEGWVRPIKPVVERRQSVGIVGAGPAGLAAADRLRRKGYRVTVHDRYDRVGGLLVYGIPNFKLDKAVVARRADLLRAGGIDFVLDFALGRDADLATLRERHDALLIATGVYKARALKAPGAGLAGVVPAMTYLTASNRQGLGDAVPEIASGALDADGKRVVVIGGGDTAMDCVRTAVRQGARAVTCLYRRDRANMPGSQREVAHAIEEGVVFEWLAAPEALLGDDATRAVRAIRMRLGPPGPDGRQEPQPIAGSSFELPCDLAIEALGFDPEDLPTLFGAPDLGVTGWGTLAVDPRTLATTLDGVFAAGDIVRGASLVVWAIRDGRLAADGIDAYLRARESATETPAMAEAI